MLARYRDPRVVPLEVWDLVIDGVPLYEVPRDCDFGAALGRVAEVLQDGSAVSESVPVFPAACRDIARVVLVGGAADEVVWTSARVPASRVAEPERCAERGGLAILQGMGLRGLVVDLGQSRLKVCGRTRRVYARELLKIPVSMRPVEGHGREALIAWVAAGLREGARDGVEGVVLALPCEISEDGRLGTCSYPWVAGDGIVEEILSMAGLAAVPVWLLNDAELAAVGVAALQPDEPTTLVLTLGFGVGGALVQGR